MKIEWSDLYIGRGIETKDGIGAISSIDKLKDEIEIFDFSSNTVKTICISEITFCFYVIKPIFSERIGLYILLLQRIENRLRDFCNNHLKKNENLTYDIGVKLLNQVKEIIQERGEKSKFHDWTKYHLKLNFFFELRETIVHGHVFHYDEDYKLAYDHIIYENKDRDQMVLNENNISLFIDFIKQFWFEMDNFLTAISIQIDAKKGI